MSYPFKLIAIIFLVLCVMFELCSCSNHYSPMDTYIDGQIQKAKDSTQHAQEVKAFLDSINNK